MRAFTLIETLVVLLLCSILLGFSIPVFQKKLRQYRADHLINTAVQQLRIARAKAIARSATVSVTPFLTKEPFFHWVIKNGFSSAGRWVFKADGESEEQGAFYLCPKIPDSDLVRAVIILETGRLRIKRNFVKWPTLCQHHAPFT